MLKSESKYIQQTGGQIGLLWKAIYCIYFNLIKVSFLNFSKFTSDSLFTHLLISHESYKLMQFNMRICPLQGIGHSQD